MKKFVFICMLVVLAATAMRACAEETALEIDAAHVYSNMTRPYAQGYSPLIKGNYAYVVLPLLAGERDYSITATLTPDAPEVAPYELNDLTEQFKPRSYSFDGERVRAYLVSFRLRLYDDCLDGDYPLTIAVLDGGRETRYHLTLSISQRASNPEKPQIDIVDCDSDLTLGETGELTLTLINRSQTRTARDIAFVMSDPDGHVLPLRSDTFSVPDLDPGDSAELTLPVRVQADAPAQPHCIKFQFNYGYGTDQTAEQALHYTLELTQQIRLNYTEPVLPARVTQGDVTVMTITLMNMGRGKIVNALLTPELPGLSSGGSVLLGDIEPGASASGTVNFRVGTDVLGEIHGGLEIYCEDEYGNSHTQNVDLATTVMAMPEPTAEDKSVGEAEQALGYILPWWLPWVLVGALALALVTVIVSCGRRVRLLEEQRL